MGFSFDCTCDWCRIVEVVQIEQSVIDVTESCPKHWHTVVIESGRLVLCDECYIARANALRDAAHYLDEVLKRAQQERIHLVKLPDEKRRRIERQAAADGR